MVSISARGIISMVAVETENRVLLGLPYHNIRCTCKIKRRKTWFSQQRCDFENSANLVISIRNNEKRMWIR